MATHSSTLAWRIPWREEPGRLQSMVSQSRTRLSDFTSLFISKYFTLHMRSVSLLKTNENEQKSTFKIGKAIYLTGASQVLLVLKSPPANVRDIRDMGSISGSGRSTGGGHGNPLQYSCLMGYSP